MCTSDTGFSIPPSITFSSSVIKVIRNQNNFTYLEFSESHNNNFLIEFRFSDECLVVATFMEVEFVAQTDTPLVIRYHLKTRTLSIRRENKHRKGRTSLQFINKILKKK